MSELSNMVSYLKIIYLFLHQKILHVIQFVQLIYIYIYILQWTPNSIYKFDNFLRANLRTQ
jgi:hypothetical protein